MVIAQIHIHFFSELNGELIMIEMGFLGHQVWLKLQDNRPFCTFYCCIVMSSVEVYRVSKYQNSNY